MNNTEKLLWAFVTVLLVIIVVILVKKENFGKDKRADVTPCAAVTKWPVCGGVCGGGKHCGPWGNNNGPHGCDCM